MHSETAGAYLKGLWDETGKSWDENTRFVVERGAADRVLADLSA
jgi:hypothetical protein